MDLLVSDQVHLIVGGTRDVGLETARLLAADGARVVLIGRDERTAVAAAAGITAEFGTEALGVGANAAEPDGLDRAVDIAVRQFGRLDGLLTAAGWASRNGPLLTATDDDFEVLHQEIFMSAARACRAAIPHLVSGGGGSIVTTGAYSVKVPSGVRVGYGAMKAAVANFTKNLALTHGRDGIRANCVCPGAMRTGVVLAAIEQRMASHSIDAAEAERQLLHEWDMTVALGRLGRPAEIATVMAFLLSPRSSYLTGALVNVDGGTDF